MKRRSIVTLFMLIWNLSSIPVNAQDHEEPALDQFTAQFKKPYLSIGALLQVVFDYQGQRSMGGNNGFRIPNAMIHFKGELDNGFGYFIQAQFRDAPSVYDAEMHYTVSQGLKFKVGLFKSPFSRAFLISPAHTDLVNKSRIVKMFTPARQIGFQVSGKGMDGVLEYRAGLFNGNGIKPKSDDDNALLSMIRLALHSDGNGESRPLSIELGVNAAHSKESNATLLGGLLPNYEGSRTLLGADFRIETRTFFICGEAVFARFSAVTDTVYEPSGFHLTFGHSIVEDVQWIFRWDALDIGDLGGTLRRNDMLIFGINFWPTRPTKFQFNYAVDLDREPIRNHQILVKSQIEL